MGPIFAPAEAKEEKVKECFETALPDMMKKIESYVKEDGWLVGDKLTMADFIFGHAYTGIVTNPRCKFGVEDGQWKAFLEQNPKFDAYGKRFSAQLTEYLAKR